MEVSALTEANAKLEESLRHNADLQEQLLTQAREAGVSTSAGAWRARSTTRSPRA